MTDHRSRSTAPHVTRLTLVLLTSTMLSGVPQLRAQVLPTGGSVAAGSAAIGTPAGGALTVTQSSSSAVVNWQSFSVGQGNTVNFVQPSSTSAILNRVTGSATSTIAGQINANGQVYLVNPNGIAITSTGTVNAAGFVASTLGISDSDFMAGKRNFTGNGASASVSNAGTITIGRGGYAALLGGSVDNAGTITVPLGKVGLGSGEQATLDLSGDGFMQVAVPTNAAGSGALVSNSGRISANGGSVQLSAAAARNMARQAINMSGTIEARSVGGRNGAIVLGGSGGAVAVSGKLNVASRRAKGGNITVTGRDIKLAGAALDASGKTGGGNINVGGGRQGQGTLQRAETTTIDSATTIKADATQTGNGGNVTVWSDGATSVHGLISATGGAISGDGGQIETSGHTLDFAGIRIDGSAVKGKSGTWLLDPEDLTVDAAAAGTISTTLGGGTNVALQTTAGTASGPGNTSTGNGDIFVNSSIGWSSSAILTLNAYNAIKINAPITVGGAGGVSLTYNTASPTNLTFASGASLDYGGTNHGGTLSINGSSYTLLYSMADVSNVNNLGLGGSYALAGSLDASGTTYTDALIGSDNSHSFIGSFEGLGHTIRNLTVNKSGDFAGLFGYSSGTIRDIGLTGGSVSGTTSVGGLVGALFGTITNAYATGVVSGTAYVGGLVGYQDSGGTIGNAYATGAVSGYAYVGGLVGYQVGGTIGNAYATGAVSGTAYVGGLVGYLDSGGTISNAYATGAVSGYAHVGGLVGAQAGGTIGNAYATGAVSGSTYSMYVGGLVGAQGGGTIGNAYATGAVSGSTYSIYVGGLVGYQAGGTIGNAYATGAVSGDAYVGGLVGYQDSGGTISNSYWDTETSGRNNGIGGGNSSGIFLGLTTAQMADPFTFIDAGWNLTSIWGTLKTGGAPVLRSLTTDPVYSYYVRLTGNASATYGDAIISGITTDGIGASNVTVGFGSGANAGTHATSESNVLALTYSTGGASDYYINYGTGNVTIAQRAITVTANSGQTFTYGDTPALTYTVGGLGLVNGDTLAGSLAGLTNTSGVGSYAITQGSLAASSNYTLTYTGANATVTQRAITVAANALSRNYGAANPALTYTVGGRGLVNGDLLSGALITDADISSTAGSYAITRGGLTASANYTMTFLPGTLTVDAVFNPPTSAIASTVANNTPPGMIVAAAMLPVTFAPPSANSSGGTVLFADPRFDNVVICGGLNCVVASPALRP